jgi:hypothetical protein
MEFCLKQKYFQVLRLSYYTLIKRKPGFSGKMFWTLEIPFKTGFTVYAMILLNYGTLGKPYKYVETVVMTIKSIGDVHFMTTFIHL